MWPRERHPQNDGVARRRAVSGRTGRGRPGRLDSLVESAVELVQSVAVEVVPPVVDAVDLDVVVQRIDLNAVLEKVDMDRLLEHVDVTRLIERVDIEAVLARVDMNAVLEKVDIDLILARTELGSVVARSGGAIASRTLDVVRSQGVGLDAFFERWTDRILRRHDASPAVGPPLLVGHAAPGSP